MLLVAGGVWFWRGSSTRALDAEAMEAVADLAYRVRCAACDHEFEMAAPHYVAQLGKQGVRCAKCGAAKAWRVGDAGDDPAAFRAEVEKLTSVDDLRSVVKETQAEYDRLEQEFLSLGDEGDPKRRAELRKQLVPLRAKLQALHMRWDELIISP